MNSVAEGNAAQAAGAFAESATRLRWRHLKDRITGGLVGVGGVTVLAALVLIFVYLLIEVLPLFRGAEASLRADFVMPGDREPTLFVGAEEQAEVGVRCSASGQVMFFDLANGSVRKEVFLPLGETKPVRLAVVADDKDLLALSLSDGSVLPFKLTYTVSYPDDKRRIEPDVEYPYGPKPLAFMRQAPAALVVRAQDDSLLMVGADVTGAVHLKTWEVQTSLMGETTFQPGPDQLFQPSVKPDELLVNPLIDWLYIVDRAAGRIAMHRLRGGSAPELVDTQLAGTPITHARFLAGGISILTADPSGIVTQWFPARHADSAVGASGADAQWYLARVREFHAPSGSEVTALGSEHRRRGFVLGTAHGEVGLYHATSQRTLLEFMAFDDPIALLSFEPRSKALLVADAAGRLKVFGVRNEHPEVSWSALWNRVWYESYDEPRTLWQSSSASSDFEPKLSLSPLTLGTVKGAFYAMIFAVPLAILGAIFTAYFMAPVLRQSVKPTVEVMQALPTVVLGFLAGLWLAPFVEENLPGVFLILIFLPLSVPLAGFLWQRLPPAVRHRVPPGWEAVLLAPVLVGVVWTCFALAKPVELLLFGGNMQGWMDHTLGIGYDQRNCLVVGIAMGVAVIPGIFTIAEDAIFSVPRHLTLGSLALGATPWQTLTGVVLPTASPGIFSAVMIGMGRAVGETMIVLMATGNTPVMDFSLFSGMRTLSANIAVEMPESEVGSTHFRMLFLAGLLLFLFTFAINTLAEVVRQRLREKYGNL